MVGSDGGGTLSFLPVPGAAPDPDVFLEEVLDAWAASLRSRGIKAGYVRTSRSVVFRLCDSAGKFPWEWNVGDATDWFDHLRSVRGLAQSTLRAYQGMIEAFCDFATSPAYDWGVRSAQMFGQVFSQVVNEFNRITHSQTNEAKPEKRAFTEDELQQLFDLLDVEYVRVLESGRSGALTVLRDAAACKIAYGWGLRVTEVRRLQIVDFSANARTPYFGDFGNLHVRFGKAKAGQVFKPRNVLTVWQWAAEVAEDWTNNVLPRYGEPLTDLFPTNTGSVVSANHLWQRISDCVDELGFPPGLDFHSLRRSYATHLLTSYRYDIKFIQMQLGHEHAATTSIYTLPAADFQIAELARVHREMLEATGTAVALPKRKLRLPPRPPLPPNRKKRRGAS